MVGSMAFPGGQYIFEESVYYHTSYGIKYNPGIFNSLCPEILLVTFLIGKKEATYTLAYPGR